MSKLHPPQHSHIYIHKKILILSGHPRSSFYLQPSFPSLLLGIGIQPCHVLLEASRWTTTAPSTQLNLMLVDGQISEKQTQLAQYLMEYHSRSSLIFGTKVTVGTPLQYSCLENPMDGGAPWAAVHGVAKSQTRLSDFTFTFHFHALEKEMATHSSVLAWRIPGMGEPGGLLYMGSHRVGRT